MQRWMVNSSHCTSHSRASVRSSRAPLPPPLLGPDAVATGGCWLAR